MRIIMMMMVRIMIPPQMMIMMMMMAVMIPQSPSIVPWQTDEREGRTGKGCVQVGSRYADHHHVDDGDHHHHPPPQCEWVSKGGSPFSFAFPPSLHPTSPSSSRSKRTTVCPPHSPALCQSGWHRLWIMNGLPFSEGGEPKFSSNYMAKFLKGETHLLLVSFVLFSFEFKTIYFD